MVSASNRTFRSCGWVLTFFPVTTSAIYTVPNIPGIKVISFNRNVTLHIPQLSFPVGHNEFMSGRSSNLSSLCSHTKLSQRPFWSFSVIFSWYCCGMFLANIAWPHVAGGTRLKQENNFFLFMCMCASTILHHPRPSASALHGHSAVGTARCVADAMNARSLLMCCCARSVTSWISSYYGPWPTVKVIYQFQFNIYVLTGSSWFIVANEISWLI